MKVREFIKLIEADGWAQVRMKGSHLAMTLVRLRFHWYAVATGKSLARQWQSLSFAVLLFPLGLPLLVIPFLGILSRTHGMGWNFAYVIVIELIGILWIVPQRRNLLGGEFMYYVVTLPLPRVIARTVDSVLLLCADGILFIPFFVTMAVLPHASNNFSYALDIALIFTLMWMVFVTQHAVLEKLPIAFPWILLANVLFCAALMVSSETAASCLVAGTLLCAGVTLFLRVESATGKAATVHAAGLYGRLTKELSHEILDHVPILLRMRVKTLSAAKGMTGMRLGCGFLIVIGADYLISAFHYDSRSLPAAIITLAVTALVVAGLYRSFQQGRASMHDYLAALPLRRGRTILNDVSIVLLIGLLPLAVLIGPMVVNNVGSAVAVAVLVVAFLLLLAFLRWPTVSGGRWTVLLGILTASCWSGAVMAAVV